MKQRLISVLEIVLYILRLVALSLPGSHVVPKRIFSLWGAVLPLAVLLHMGFPAATIGTVRAQIRLLPGVGPDVSREDPRLAEHSATEGAGGRGGLLECPQHHPVQASPILHLQQRGASDAWPPWGSHNSSD